MHRRQNHAVKDSLWIVANQGLCHKPVMCANVATPEISERGVTEDQHTHTCFSHMFQSLLLYCSVPATLTATATQTILPMREQLPQERRHHQTRSLRTLLASLDWSHHGGHESFWTGNALKNKKLKNYLVVLCHSKELFKIRKELRKMHIFWKELRKMFYFKIENLRIRILKRCFSLILYIIWRLKRILYVFITLIIVLLKEKSLPFLYVYALFWVGKESLAFSVCTAAGQNSSFWDI